MTEHRVRHKTIGYWMSEKKRQKLNWTEFDTVCRKNGYNLIKLDLSLPLDDQGPFNVILHKLTDIIALAGQGDKEAEMMIKRVECYIKAHPEVAVIDPLENVRNLLDRYRSYSIIHNSDLEEVDVFIPTFVELTSDGFKENLETLKIAGVTFPFVCKPSVAHGSSEAHKMAVIFNAEGVKDCKPPCVAQTFINHNATLYKIYFVGDEYFVVERPSLKNFYSSDHKTIFFDSHDVSKADSTSSLSILDPEDQKLVIMPPDAARFKRIVTTLRKEFRMSLLGVDVVIENESGRYGIIDINAYPGYDGFPNFFEVLMNCIHETIHNHLSNAYTLCQSNGLWAKESRSVDKHLSREPQPVAINQGNVESSFGNGDHEDSGFDTCDSSDEKKKTENNLRGDKSELFKTEGKKCVF